MNKYSLLNVFIEERKVGTLAKTNDYRIAFEYDPAWIENGFSISPFSLPLQKEVFIPKKYETFEGLFGVFSDSLPDGWGRLLVDRLLRQNKLNPTQVESLERLSIVGKSGMGALTYHPEKSFSISQSNLSFDQIAEECEKIFESHESENLDEIFHMGGSSGGARPKIFYTMEDEEWIVKFPSSMDDKNIGAQEYEYALCAKECGIEMAEVKLLPSLKNTGYFATKRFDRRGTKRIHMISASGLLEISHRLPNLDYNILMKLTMKLCNDYCEVEKLYRLMCFNVFAHNRDDHSKNFSFLFDEGRWRLSPAYDLTFSSSIGGEHATTIDGNGKNPSVEDLLSVAKNIKLDLKKAQKIIVQTQEAVYSMLGEYIKSFI